MINMGQVADARAYAFLLLFQSPDVCHYSASYIESCTKIVLTTLGYGLAEGMNE
jgi:hypothetical protein